MENTRLIATGLEATAALLVMAAGNLEVAAAAANASGAETINSQLHSLQQIRLVLVRLAADDRAARVHFNRSSLTSGGELGEFPVRR